jgi:hypothetical protein
VKARAAVRSAMTFRRALLALAAFSGWWNLAWMLRLTVGTPAAQLGRGGWLAGPLRAATPIFGLLMAISSAGLVRRRTRYFGAAGCFLILWMFDFVVRKPEGEHGHLFPLTACLVFAGVGFLRGARDSSERTAWEACCAYIGAAYFLSGVSKLRYVGFGWAQARSIQMLVMNGTAQARGWLLGARRFMAASPRLVFFGAGYTLLLELLGPVLLVRRWRILYLAALFLMHLGIFFGMGIVMGAHFFLVAVAAAVPFEAAFLRVERELAARIAAQAGAAR